MDGHVITWSKKEDVLESELNMIGEITMNTQKKNCEYSHIKKTRSRVKTRCTWGYSVSFVSYLWSKNWVSEKSNKALNHQSSQASLNPAHGIKSLRFQFDPQSKSLCNIYTFSLSFWFLHSVLTVSFTAFLVYFCYYAPLWHTAPEQGEPKTSRPNSASSQIIYVRRTETEVSKDNPQCTGNSSLN